MPTLPPPPLSTEFHDRDGRVSMPWQKWFQLLGSITLTGGGGGSGGVGLSNAIPEAIGAAAAGAAGTASRHDHVHAHGSQLGGALHADADLSSAGFLSSLGNRKLRALGIYPIEDGGDADDISTAISDAQSAGYAQLHFRDGEWSQDAGALSDDSGMVIIPTGFSLTGNGLNRSIINVTNTTTGAGLDGCALFRTAANASRMKMKGLHFKGDNTSGTYVLNNQNAFIDVDSSGTVTDFTIEECFFENGWGFSVHDRQGNTNSRIHVLRCWLYQMANGINVNANDSQQGHNVLYKSEGFEASGARVQIFRNTGHSLFGVGATIGGNQTPGGSYPDNEVTNNIFVGITDGCGITVADCAHATRIQNNTVRFADAGALVVAASVSEPVALDISGNTFESNCKDPGANLIGMDIRAGSKHKVFNNTCLDLGVPGFNQKYGLGLSFCDSVMVIGNRLEGTLKDATFTTGATNVMEGFNDFVNNSQEWISTSTRRVDSTVVGALANRVRKTMLQYQSGADDYAAISEDGAGKRYYAAGSGGVPYDLTTERSAAGVYKITGALLVTAGGTFQAPNTYKGATGLTAHAGGGQASALALTAEENFVTTVATAGDSVKLLPTAALGSRVVVFNLGANACDVFPVSGGAIDALATNAAYSLAAGSSREFWGQSATQWRSR